MKNVIQKNLDGILLRYEYMYFPKKILKNKIRRDLRNNKVQIVTNCRKCNKPILSPFNGCLCGDCLREWDIQKYARILALYTYGKAIRCEKCGWTSKKGIEWHHWDYTKPLWVIGLCRKCHGLARWRTKEEFDAIIVKKRMNSL